MRDTAEAERREREEAKWELLKRCRMIEHDEAQETERKLRDQMKKRNQRADLDTQVVRRVCFILRKIRDLDIFFIFIIINFFKEV